MGPGDTVRLLGAATNGEASRPGATVVLIDGRSGSGKSTLADEVNQAWAGSTVVHLDDIYPGWDGLLWAAEHIRTDLLEPLAEGRPGRWQSWDWQHDRPAEWHTVPLGQRLIIEGVGALTPANRALASLGVWVEADDQTRKSRALARDGATYRPHWDRWAAHETHYLAQYNPRRRADLVATMGARGTAPDADAPDSHTPQHPEPRLQFFLSPSEGTPWPSN